MASSRTFELPDHVREELPISEKALGELRALRQKLSQLYEGGLEYFDFGWRLDLGSEQTLAGKLERLGRACIWHALGLKFEFKLKLLHTIDGYLSAIDAKNPVSTNLLARHLLELAATVSAIDDEITEVCRVDFRDWKARGYSFLVALYRARHSTSDPAFKSVMARNRIPAKLTKPIHINDAIKSLTSKHGFAEAESTYHQLSNVCHSNGSGHKLLVEGGREAKTVTTRGGRRISIDRSEAVFSLAYPASRFAVQSLATTARMSAWCAYSANEMIEGLREEPYTDEELASLTNGELCNAQCFGSMKEPRIKGAKKIGRNDPCPCGSGAKYKACCLRAMSLWSPPAE